MDISYICGTLIHVTRTSHRNRSLHFTQLTFKKAPVIRQLLAACPADFQPLVRQNAGNDCLFEVKPYINSVFMGTLKL